MALLQLLSILGWSKSRTECFAAMVLGAISDRNIQHHALAAGFDAVSQKVVSRKSLIRRIERFFKEQVIDFLQLPSVILAIMGIPQSAKLHLAMDRTNWKFGLTDINILVLAAHFPDGSAVPLLWSTLPHQGNSDAKVRIKILEDFEKTIGLSRIASFTADREFVGEEWLTHLVQHKIPFYIRTKDGRLVSWGTKKRPLKDFFDELATDEERVLYKAIGQHNLMVVGRRNIDGELIVVISNQTDRNKVMSIYKARWRIETLFRNTKTSGFHMELTHMRHIDRIKKLMAVIALAAALVIRTGQEEIKKKETPYRKTVRAPLCSVFTRGFRTLREIMSKTAKNLRKWLKSLLKDHVSLKSVG